MDIDNNKPVNINIIISATIVFHEEPPLKEILGEVIM